MPKSRPLPYTNIHLTGEAPTLVLVADQVVAPRNCWHFLKQREVLQPCSFDASARRVTHNSDLHPYTATKSTYARHWLQSLTSYPAHMGFLQCFPVHPLSAKRKKLHHQRELLAVIFSSSTDATLPDPLAAEAICISAKSKNLNTSKAFEPPKLRPASWSPAKAWNHEGLKYTHRCEGFRPVLIHAIKRLHTMPYYAYERCVWLSGCDIAMIKIMLQWIAPNE